VTRPGIWKGTAFDNWQPTAGTVSGDSTVTGALSGQPSANRSAASRRYNDALDATNAHRQQYESMARQIAQRYGINPDVFCRMIMKESSFNPRANENNPDAVAFGIAQFTPETGAKYGLHQQSDFFNPQKALTASARHIKDLLAHPDVNGDYAKALSTYNSGDPNAYKNPKNKETYQYVKNILPNNA
jgi:soluble lytic murein transglycosylase-like protein